MTKILITGGTGLIGQQLSYQLHQLGYTIHILTRNKKHVNNNYKAFEWDVSKNYIDKKAFENVTHIIHLAGEGIADKRWTDKRQKEIIDSRTKSMAIIVNSLNELNINLTGFVGASAIGIYGAKTVNQIFKEDDLPATDFLGQTCKAWEAGYEAIQKKGVATSIIRIGVVLAKNGGAYKKMSAPFKYGLGASLGNGKQYMPWIHIDDLISIIIKATLGEIPTGIYNAVANEHITNAQFSKLIATYLNKPYFLPAVPAFVLKIILGKLSAVVLEGSRVSNEKLIQTGFKFKHDSIQSALKALNE